MVASLYGPDEAEQSIWVYVEHDQNRLLDVSLELITKALELAGESSWHACGLILGSGVEALVAQALELGLHEIFCIDDPLLDRFDVSVYSKACFEVVMAERPGVFLLGATPDARDLAGRLAVRLRTGLNADCTDLRLDVESGHLTSEVSGFGGGVIALLESPDHRPQMSTVRPGVFQHTMFDTEGEGVVHNTQISLSKNDLQSELLERSVGEQLDLSKVDLLICGGRGMHGQFDMLRTLAEQLDGDVGATRPPVDEGFIERERQIGQTGVVCRPKIALTCGISGAFHFVVGIQDADTVIAINIDPDAPIFDYCDYGIVGDVNEILPALIQTLEKEPDKTHA